MKRLTTQHPWHSINTWDEIYLNAYIEIAPSDTVKYEIDKKSGLLKVDRPQKFSNRLPAHYGFIPKTYSGQKSSEYGQSHIPKQIQGDKDPIDLFVITEHELRGGILVNCLPIGGFRMVDGSELDDKIIAVLKDDASYGHIRDLKDCPEGILDKIHHYLTTYKNSKKVEIYGTYGAKEAKKIIKLGQKDYNHLYKK